MHAPRPLRSAAAALAFYAAASLAPGAKARADELRAESSGVLAQADTPRLESTPAAENQMNPEISACLSPERERALKAGLDSRVPGATARWQILAFGDPCEIWLAWQSVTLHTNISAELDLELLAAELAWAVLWADDAVTQATELGTREGISRLLSAQAISQTFAAQTAAAEVAARAAAAAQGAAQGGNAAGVATLQRARQVAAELQAAAEAARRAARFVDQPLRIFPEFGVGAGATAYNGDAGALALLRITVVQRGLVSAGLGGTLGLTRFGSQYVYQDAAGTEARPRIRASGLHGFFTVGPNLRVVRLQFAVELGATHMRTRLDDDLANVDRSAWMPEFGVGARIHVPWRWLRAGIEASYRVVPGDAEIVGPKRWAAGGPAFSAYLGVAR